MQNKSCTASPAWSVRPAPQDCPDCKAEMNIERGLRGRAESGRRAVVVPVEALSEGWGAGGNGPSIELDLEKWARIPRGEKTRNEKFEGH